MTDEESHFSMEVSLGNLRVEVTGSDEEWVRENFEEAWESALEDGEEMARALRTGDRTTA